MVIATRKILIRASDQDSEMEIRLFQPIYDDRAWTCNYEMDWPDGMKAGFAVGFDAMQAIILALQSIGADLYVSPYHAKSQLIWVTPGAGYGFLVPGNMRDMLIGNDISL